MQRRQQVEELFHAALEREPAERDTFLSQACRTDPELRAEVESLISAHEQPGSFLDSLGYDRGSDTSTPSLVGQSIGRYLILSLLGRGGMGDVYLARDTQLDRKLALKLLPEQYTADEIRVRRFMLEARAASSLNHPNIITIHEIGHFGSVHFIATEFVEGETLRHRIMRGPIAIVDALDIATQIASALAAAHAAGIVHRDIKPENIMVRPDRYVKVLDFGLAKLTERPAISGLSDASTDVRIDTDPGTVMGTTRYMSPEQARGLAVDARSDLFNLGVVICEMITGRAPFTGDTPADIVAAILKTDPPPLADSGLDSPADLQRVVSKALNKAREDRYQTSEEILAELRAVKERLEFEAKLTRTGASLSTGSIATLRRVLPAPVMYLLLLAVVAAATVVIRNIVIRYWPPKSTETTQISSDRQLHSVQVLNWRNVPGESRSDPKLSPDGSQIAYSFIDPGSLETIWIREKDGSRNAVPVPNDGSSRYSPIWSPDGQQIAFVSQAGSTFRMGAVAYRGGTPTWFNTQFKSLNGTQPVLRYWSQTGPTIFYELKNNLFAFNLSSNETTQLTSFDDSAPDPRYFSISPKEDLIAYREGRDGKFDLWVRPVQGGAATQVTNDPQDDRAPYWLPDGQRLLYASGREGGFQLCVASVDGREPVPLPVSEGGSEVSDVSRDGSKILQTESRDLSNILGVKTSAGEEFEVTSNLDVDVWPDVSPDGTALAFQTTDKPDVLRELLHSTILIKSLANPGQVLKLVSDGYSPKWLPGGSRLSFLRLSDSDSRPNLWTVSATGGDEVQLTRAGLLRTGYTLMPYSRIEDGGPNWSSDSSRVIYCANRSGVSNVWMASTDGASEKNLSNNNDTDHFLSCPFWSPNNSEIAYVEVSPPSAGMNKRTWDVYVKGEDTARLIFESNSYLRLLGWSHTGNEVYIATVEGTTRPPVADGEVTLLRVSTVSGNRIIVTRLRSTYPFTLRPSPEGDEIAFVSRREGKDDIWLVASADGRQSKITGNNNPGLYYSSPAWSPDGKTVYYGRQEKRTLVSMIDNFQ